MVVFFVGQVGSLASPKTTGEDFLARGECSTAMTAQFSQSPAPAVRERAADLQAAHATGNEYLGETLLNVFGGFVFFFLVSK